MKLSVQRIVTAIIAGVIIAIVTVLIGITVEEFTNADRLGQQIQDYAPLIGLLGGLLSYLGYKPVV